MALAILESLGSDGKGEQFRIDTGTNRFYRLKVGRTKERRAGVEWVGEITFATPVGRNPRAGDPFRSSTDVVIPAQHFEGGHSYVQLFSFKTADGISPAFSPVVLVATGFGTGPLDFGIEDAFSRSTSMNTNAHFLPARTVPCRTGAQTYAAQASIADLIGQVIKVAAPIVTNLLGGAGAPAGGSGGATGGAAAGSGSPGDFVAQLLKSILGALGQGQAAAPAPAPAPAPTVAPPPAKTQSILNGGANRFARGDLSRPFIFGVDDALIAAVAGPVLQVLPQLMNSMNQNRLQMKQQQNNLITNLVSGVNQRMMIDKLLQAQAAGGQANPDINQLLQVLQQAAAAPAGQAAPVATGQSVSVALPQRPEAELSKRAVLSFVTAEPITFNGSPTLLFSRKQPMQLKLRLTVSEPIPKRPLPRAIVSIVFKDCGTQAVCFEKTSRYTNVSAGDVLPITFTQDELARLPANKPLAAIAEMRWPGRPGAPARSALGSIDIALVDQYFLKTQGSATTDELELTDMQRFRPFWNKVWEAPSLNAAATDESRKRRWALNVSTKYTVLLRSDQNANGVMETKLLQQKGDPDSLAESIEGRMKAGIELSIAELNKLLPLWNNNTPLDLAKLEALSSPSFARDNAGEFVQSLVLKGRAGERGMVWVVPVFKLFALTLGVAGRTDDTGQIVEATDETVAFPLPVAARVIGLKSE